MDFHKNVNNEISSNETQHSNKRDLFISNAQFRYKDITSFNYKNRIKLNPENEPNLFLPANAASHHFRQNIIREHPHNYNKNAFSDADIQIEVTDKRNKDKRDIFLQKDRFFNKIITDRNSKIQSKIEEEKKYLKTELTRIIKDALIFCRKNHIMTSMLPNNLNEIIAKAKEDTKTLTLSNSSINLTQTTRKSTRSVQKYESNAFLKALGIDLVNLNPDNININIDKAYEFVKKWKHDRDVNQILRYKVINEIMSVEEKRTSKKVELLNQQLKIIKDKKREEKQRQKNLLEETLRSKKPSEKIKRQMMQSVFMVHDFSDKKNKPVVELRQPYSEKKKRPRTNKSKNDIHKIKKLVRYNSYDNLDNILNFIQKSNTLRENEPIRTHFVNLDYNKKINQACNKLKKRNRISSII